MPRAQEVGIRLVVGCRIDVADGLPLLAYPLDRTGYGRLCRMITLAKAAARKGTFDLGRAYFAAHAEGLLLVMPPDEPDGNLNHGG